MIKKFTTLLACVTLIASNLAAQTTQGFKSITPLTPLTVTANTSDKPQSKVWKHDGKWWTVLADAEGTFVWRLDNRKWTKIVKISASKYEKADCKVVGNVVHVLLFRGTNTPFMTSVEYSKEANAYKLWSKRDYRVPLVLDEGVETATIDIDGTGRMWLASDGASTVNVRWSDPPYEAWSEPITLASGIKEDDICAVIAMQGKIGVLWSDQTTQRFGFRMHTDGASPTDWSADEVPASQSALKVGMGMADDHLNMTLASDGTLYCAVKTSYNRARYPQVALLVRRPDGTWDDLYKVTDTDGTRPIVVLNEKLGILKVVYTSDEQGGDIRYKEAHTSNLSGLCSSEARNVFEGKYNYVSSSKEPYTDEVLLLATNLGSKNLEAVGLLGTDGPANMSEVPLPCDNVADAIMVYPNPFSKKATFRFPPLEGRNYSISLYDTKGARVSDILQGQAATSEWNEIEIDGTNLARGFYIIRLETESGVYNLKLVREK